MNPNKNRGEIYIAGPINGVKNWKTAFKKAAKKLEAEGWSVTSPMDYCEEPSLRAIYAVELDWIARFADAIYMLKGWERSVGSQAEWATARAVGIKIIYE